VRAESVPGVRARNVRHPNADVPREVLRFLPC
jgi:hypothetical protein